MNRYILSGALISSIVIVILLAYTTMYWSTPRTSTGSMGNTSKNTPSSITPIASTYTGTNTSIGGGRELTGYTSCEIIDMVDNYLKGGEAIHDLDTIIKKYLEDNGSPIICDSRVLFVYVGRGRNVFVAGDWNNWDPHIDKMVKISDDVSMLIKEFPLDARLDYKFVIDSRWILDPYNNRTIMGGFGPNSELVMPQHKFPEWYNVPENIPGGRFLEYTLDNPYIGRSHRVEAYIPYNTDRIDTIIYFYDGGDYINLCKAHRVIDYLVYKGYISNIAAVFVSPSDPGRRIEEYGKRLEDTYRFLVEKVIPYIEDELEIQGNVSRIIVGDSLAGLMATYTMLKSPGLFIGGIIQSPAYWYNSEPLMKLIDKIGEINLKIYIHYGTYEGVRFTNIIDEIAGRLEGKGANIELKRVHQGHSWGQWREELGYGILWILD